ncbi:hypothetical protein BDB01DRAFT_809621 [Pilobolus umbonatus]|nr:hypothetical protein BDB01DRAFT_829523 [Pilobolus umbonatus]KAI8972693.1 hypothetical protein BDB01DRAFT_809621 [Pilobolus umbonatus]
MLIQKWAFIVLSSCNSTIGVRMILPYKCMNTSSLLLPALSSSSCSIFLFDRYTYHTKQSTAHPDLGVITIHSLF